MLVHRRVSTWNSPHFQHFQPQQAHNPPQNRWHRNCRTRRILGAAVVEVKHLSGFTTNWWQAEIPVFGGENVGIVGLICCLVTIHSSIYIVKTH